MIAINPHDPTGIIWIASYPRSGNTWMRAFITALHEVMRDPAASELDINRIDEGYAAENSVDLYPRFLGKPVSLATPAEIARARPQVQAALARSLGRPIYLKTHNAKGLDHGQPLINARVSLGAIYVVRNPLDVAVSYARFSNVPVDRMIRTMATRGWGIPASDKRVQVIPGSWSENVESWTARTHPAVLVVRYEDMIGSPERTFARVARHIAVRPGKDQLRRALGMTDFERLRDKEAASGFREKPETADRFFREGRAGQWREVLSAEQVSAIVAAHKPLMRRFGYLPR